MRLEARSWSENVEKLMVLLGFRALTNIWERGSTGSTVVPLRSDCELLALCFLYFWLKMSIFLLVFDGFWNLGFDVSRKACLLRKQAKI